MENKGANDCVGDCACETLNPLLSVDGKNAVVATEDASTKRALGANFIVQESM